MFFRFCYSSMCGAIFLFWHFSPALQILWHFSALVSHFRGRGALMEIKSLPHTPWWQWQSRQWWQTSHLTLTPTSALLCTSNCTFSLIGSFFHPKKYLPIHFLSASETRAMLVWSVGLKDRCVTHYCLHVLRRAIYLKRVISSYMELVFFLP